MHYVNAVTPKVNAIDGVAVDLRPGDVSQERITSATALDDQRAQAALQEAGYPLVPA
ncbi:MAG: heavy metal transporter [Candidatus Nanopelagicales bacterium]|nr:heavy metal transporter [Candidatus Nanopelagicales bacterium]